MAAIKFKNRDFSTRKTRTAVSVYLMDHLVESKRVEFLENMYGGKDIVHRSAIIIQKCFRNYIAIKKTKLISVVSTISSTESCISQTKNSIIIENNIDLSIDKTDSPYDPNDPYNPNDPFAIHNDEDRKRLFDIGKNLFNRNCNKGINFLIKHGILEPDGSSIVKFFNTEGLSFYAKGDFMSQDNNKLAVATRREFLSKMSFHNSTIESSVRKLFSKIRIPGETQKILTMLEDFHIIYLDQNIDIKNALKKEDTVVLISFAILMLHTSLYNPSAAKQDKMKKEQFIKIFKGINDEDFINEKYLDELYDNIKKKQMKPLSDHTDLVRNIYADLTGPLLPKDLIQNHRKFIRHYNCNEIPNIKKKPNSHAHNREIFLFNDLLLVTKPVHNNSEFYVRHVIPLLGIKVNQFRTEYYPIGLEIMKTESTKPLIYVDCIDLTNRKNIMTNISAYIEEVNQLDVLRSGGEIEVFSSIKKKKT